MSRTFTQKLGILGFLFASATSAISQEAKESMVRTDLMSVTLHGKIDTYFVTHGEVKTLEAYSSAMAPPIFYKGPRKLRLYATAEDARKSIRPPKEDPPKPVAIVQLPVKARRTLLFQLQDPEKKLQVRAIGVEDHKLGGGDFRIFNMTSLKLLGKMGKKSFTLSPGQIHDISASSLGSVDADLTVKFGNQSADGQHLVYSSLWAHSSTCRNYVFLVGTGNPRKPVRVKKFFDVPSAESLGFVKETP